MALQDTDMDGRIGDAIKFLRLVGEADSVKTGLKPWAT
jgi:hypothetical protein